MHPDPDDDLSALRAALEVEPGPGFAAGVRRRVALERTWAWRPLAAGVVATAALAAGAIFWLPWSQRPVEPAAPRLAARETPRVASTPGSAAVESRPSTAEVRTVELAASRLAPSVRRDETPRPESRVLIARDEARAFARLLVAVRAGQVGLPADDDPVRRAIASAMAGPQPVPIVRVDVPLEFDPYPDLEN